MKFVQSQIESVAFPRVHAYVTPGSQQAADVGACYMLIEGFCGNTLHDVSRDLTFVSLPMQEHIMSQWASIQTELASFTFERLGSISQFSEGSEPVIGRLACGVAEGFTTGGPFRSAHDFFTEVADARYRQVRRDSRKRSRVIDYTILGPYIFEDIVARTDLFKQPHRGPFQFSHMDLGTHNILVDDNFNFLAVIDWEFAQTAPVQVNKFPMPFPLLLTDVDLQCILLDYYHPGHASAVRQLTSRKLYQRKLHEAEEALRRAGRPLAQSLADALDGPASRIYAAFEQIAPFADCEALTYLMIRLAFEPNVGGAEEYVRLMDAKERLEARS